jgi:hypothetical protein
MSDQPTGFFVAPFLIDGNLEDIGFWEFAELSEQWLGTCQSILDHYDASFEMPWQGNLSHISTKVTSASGAALVTFRIHGTIASSIALVSGVHSQVEDEVLRMYTESLRRISLAQGIADSPEAFEKARSIKERPLMIVVPWPQDAIDPNDYSLIQELAIHLAAAFFKKAANETSGEN